MQQVTNTISANKPLKKHAPYLARKGRAFDSKRGDFLAQLESAGRYKYRRYNGLPLRYAGGKSLAVGHVIEHLPRKIDGLVSPFFGGGSVEIACAKELGLPVQGYDVFDILVNYWRVQCRAPLKLAERIAQYPPDEKTYKEVKARLKAHWDKSEAIAEPIDLAAHYWFNHNLSYGPGFLGWMSKIYQEPCRVQRLIDKVRHFRCPNLRVAQNSFEQT